MENRSRSLLVGGVMAAVILVGLAVGFVLLRSSDSSPKPSETPTPVATDERVQVEQAYLLFWDRWAQSNLQLNPALLDEVATGEALRGLVEQIEEQRAKNQPVRISVEHNYDILITDENTASVDDRYVNHSQRLDPSTKQPIESDPNAMVRKSHTLKKVDGRWKVAEIIEYR